MVEEEELEHQQQQEEHQKDMVTPGHELASPSPSRVPHRLLEPPFRPSFPHHHHHNSTHDQNRVHHSLVLLLQHLPPSAGPLKDLLIPCSSETVVARVLPPRPQLPRSTVTLLLFPRPTNVEHLDTTDDPPSPTSENPSKSFRVKATSPDRFNLPSPPSPLQDHHQDPTVHLQLLPPLYPPITLLQSLK